MLKLEFDFALGPGREPLPDYLGGVLHGYVEGAVKNHDPHILPVLRPGGADGIAHFMILPPPMTITVEGALRFAVMLYRDAAKAWPIIVRALIEQQVSRLNGRLFAFRRAWCSTVDGERHDLVRQGRLIEFPEGPPVHRCLESLAALAQPHHPARGFYRLNFRTPLLLASRKAQRERERIAHGLPWPTLGSVLDSIAARCRQLEPELAAAIGLPETWQAPAVAHALHAYTPAGRPARQIEWLYSSTPRQALDTPPDPARERRSLVVRGLLGELGYPVPDIPHAAALLHWGQWLGVGQKTTMGCGHYVLAHG